LLALSSELPIIIEFFDEPERVKEVIEKISDLVKPELVISWSAQSGI
jgi:PII-like signaling protein